MNQTIQWKKTQPGSTEEVRFSDGMLVTAEDLTAAMRYPLSVIQVLLRAYFGCGIVCGLGLRDPVAGAGETKAVRNPATGQLEPVRSERDPSFILMVDKGVALGCDGYPIEICGPLKLDLTPDPCRLDQTDQTIFVAVRRVTAVEAAARPCGCGSTGGEPAQQCTRMRDHALVQAFDEAHLPAELCRVAPSPSKELPGGVVPGHPAMERPTGKAAVCACLKACGDCACCGEPWVLLGTVVVGRQGLGRIDRTQARYVRPIACVCDAVERDDPVERGDAAEPDRTKTTLDELSETASK